MEPTLDCPLLLAAGVWNHLDDCCGHCSPPPAVRGASTYRFWTRSGSGLGEARLMSDGSITGGGVNGIRASGMTTKAASAKAGVVGLETGLEAGLEAGNRLEAELRVLSGLGGTAGGSEAVRERVGGRAGGGRGRVVLGGRGRPAPEVTGGRRGGLEGRVTAAMGLSDSHASMSAPRSSTRWSGAAACRWLPRWEELRPCMCDRPDASCMAGAFAFPRLHSPGQSLL